MSYLKRVLFVVAAAFFVAVVLTPVTISADGDDLPPATNRMQQDHAPTPFSAAEIRKGCPRGRTIVFQVEAFGKAMMFQSIEFLTVGEKEVVFESVTKSTDGKQMGPRRMTTGTWKDLQSHASFPAAQTQINSEPHGTTAGTFDCWFYQVTTKKDGKTNVKRYWFAKKIPGPPIEMEETQDGKTTFKMVMLKTGLK